MASSELIFFRLAELEVKIGIFFPIFFRDDGEAEPSFSHGRRRGHGFFLYTQWAW